MCGRYLLILPADAMLLYPLSAQVNSVRYDDPDCTAPAAAGAPRQPALF